MFTININNDFLKSLDKIVPNIQNAVDNSVEELGNEAYNKAMQFAPEGKTSGIISNISYTSTPKGTGRVAIVFIDMNVVPYAVWVELGERMHLGKKIYMNTVPGGYRYMEKAFEHIKEIANDVIKKHLRGV